jgi:hypothetical protein
MPAAMRGALASINDNSDVAMRKMWKGRRKKKRFHNKMDDIEKGYNNDMYGSCDFDQIKNKVHYFIYHGE